MTERESNMRWCVRRITTWAKGHSLPREQRKTLAYFTEVAFAMGYAHGKQESAPATTS